MTDIPKGRKCTKCGKWKPMDEFYKHATSRYGREAQCKECRQKAWRRPKSDAAIEKERLFAQGLKRCSRCGQIKSLDDFYKRATNLDGLRFWCKQCSNAQLYQYRAKNPEKIRAIDYKYRASHREEIRARERRRRPKNPKVLESKKLREQGLRRCNKCRQIKFLEEFYEHAAVRHGYRSICKECDQLQRDIYRAKIWANRPEQFRAYKNTYRTRQAKAGGSFTAKEWNTLLNKYGHCCLCCGSSEKPLDADHIIPVSQGGNSDIENIQPLCRSCNSCKGTQTIDYRPDHQGQ